MYTTKSGLYYLRISNHDNNEVVDDDNNEQDATFYIMIAFVVV